jgi:hypothetical protein
MSPQLSVAADTTQGVIRIECLLQDANDADLTMHCNCRGQDESDPEDATSKRADPRPMSIYIDVGP